MAHKAWRGPAGSLSPLHGFLTVIRTYAPRHKFMAGSLRFLKGYMIRFVRVCWAHDSYASAEWVSDANRRFLE